MSNSKNNLSVCTNPKDRALVVVVQKRLNKHHTFICGKSSSTFTESSLTTTENNVIYPAAIAKINSLKCRGLLDTGSGSFLTKNANLTIQKLKIYFVKIQDVNGKYSFNTELNKLERGVLLALPNLKHSRILKKKSIFKRGAH